MCSTWLAEIQDAKKIAKNSPSGHHRTILSDCIFATKAYIDNGEKFVKQQYLLLSTQPLAAEIDLGVWGTPANFDGFPVLASLLRRRRLIVSNCGVK